MKKRLQIYKKADSSAYSSEQDQLRAHLLTTHSPKKPLVQAKVENQKFQGEQFEATKLQIQAKYGTITPQGRERLTVLQTKMNESLQQNKEHSSQFGHNLNRMAIKRPNSESSPQIQPFSEPLIQPKLTISQPGDQYEQEADRVANSVVNQINIPTLQNQDSQQPKLSAKTEEILTADNSADRKQKFLQEYSLAKKLVNGIEETLAEDKILEQLFKNFENIQFKYTMVSKSHETLLKGSPEGDCQTLTRAFKKVAEEYFGITKITIESLPKPFISEGGKTPYRGQEPNCDDGKRWFFQNHYWAVWNGKIYDVLFLSQKRVEPDKAKQDRPLRSMLMPEQEYYETEKGKVVYPYQNKYSTVELAVFEKVINFVKNLNSSLYKNIDSMINKIRSLFTKGGKSNDFDSLLRELENDNKNRVTSNNQSQ
jgi:hypothetical protein